MYEKYMKLALELAQKGSKKVNSDPMVGAVIVKDSKIISTGYHMEDGKEHAGINAINNANEDITGSTIYVTLEPCINYGELFISCADAIIKNKISKVVIGYIDPNSKMCGKGVKKLIDNGVEIVVGVLEKECRQLNEVFIKYTS
ncbi:bifunctional diaminohydroxyphosphoribosylaminopyrimidine deaminase/5-amino-6-(5-phosphoribosylamino)uracil reductase RibD [Romboutsia sp.]|uniref:bifunctional diaminohydroxyphosphoribosylaminopyrimidine deaminase/5-amino-6-(5-phosphoribosylamino)uracil reductase RibD n=1 Tax=Romboutsia sp. TaxID=1965302 RepID=UPI003F3FF87A